MPWPSLPYPDWPQLYAAPASSAARLCESPAEAWTTRFPESARTIVGTKRDLPSPRPSSPMMPLPQLKRSPDVLIARLCAPPALTWIRTSLASATRRGKSKRAAEPIPSWPLSAEPQLYALPPAVSASMWPHPHVTCVMRRSASAFTDVGELRGSKSPCPRAPHILLPHVMMRPPVVSKAH
eukprot:scaffold44169_cov71-Phaeocystis_antarctica.AAC.6